MRSETQPYSTVLQSLIAIRLCRTAHAIFFPKFWNDKMNFTRVFVTHPEGPGTEVAQSLGTGSVTELRTVVATWRPF